MLKFRSDTIFLTWPFAKKDNSMHPTIIVATVLIKFGWDQMKAEGVAFLNFHPDMILC